MHIELKSTGSQNHKAFDNFKQLSQGGIVILNELANKLELHDLNVYAELVGELEKYTDLPRYSLIKVTDLTMPIRHKKDRLANEQRYKGRYDNGCWAFITKDDISEEDLLFLAQYIFNKYKQICIVYSFKTQNVYEFSHKILLDHKLDMEKDFMKRCNDLKLKMLKEYIIKEIIKDRKYTIYKFDTTKAYRNPVFTDKQSHIILKAITKNNIYFMCIPMVEGNTLTCFYENQKPEVIKSSDFDIDTMICDDLISIRFEAEARLHSKILYSRD